MKETRSYSLSVFESFSSVINVDRIENKVLKFFVAVVLFPITLFFLLVALLLEEPIKCIISIVFMKTTPKEAVLYYKKCWSSLLGGMVIGNSYK